MESQDVKLARIEEGVKYIKEYIVESRTNFIEPMSKQVSKNTMDIALLKSDRKWQKTILHSFFGLVGVIVGAVVEFLRK